MNEEPTLSGLAIERAQPSVGETLRAARVAKGLELSQIANTTRVPLRHLQAIEADDHDALPALPYTIGFVRTLARAVGADADAMVAHYRAETSKTPHVPQHVQIEAVDESRVPPRWLVAAAIALIALILAGVWAYGEGYFDQEPAPAPVVAEADVIAPAPEPEPVPAAPVETAALPDTQPADGTLPAGEGVVAPEGTTSETDPAAAAPVGTPVTGGPVVITSTEEVWFKVYDRATRQSVKMGILQPGERYVVPSDRDDLLLWTGKAGSLKISVAGRQLPALGGPETMIKDVSLTPASLLARAGG